MEGQIIGAKGTTVYANYDVFHTQHPVGNTRVNKESKKSCVKVKEFILLGNPDPFHIESATQWETPAHDNCPRLVPSPVQALCSPTNLRLLVRRVKPCIIV